MDGPRDRVQSAVSQKEKNKYRMLTHIYGIKNKKQKQKKTKKNKQTKKQGSEEPRGRTRIKMQM